MTATHDPRFKICELGDNKPLMGLENLPLNHAQILMLMPEGEKCPADLAMGESCICRGIASSTTEKNKRKENVFTVVRTA